MEPTTPDYFKVLGNYGLNWSQPINPSDPLPSHMDRSSRDGGSHRPLLSEQQKAPTESVAIPEYIPEP
ncbi:MAG: hypothetical protein QY330_05395 [Candidatus Dojkabacteria bacterium]|uniref:Uncharacterized protein n=2 Tax=Candidatus Dojkabacteria TaxID=74243 RepID=A0A136KKD8_9BACT|nr:MAG: hypothetical protein UZ20_WS6002000182 [candidate division WS6 bacterium OLB21]MBW7953853.1 hypothetical protein [Candidatus Dojkabacteria bacterium]WKZ27943.1 MAG: hypothetical protein QY330_05395 [Candidatus Dojkabacteria bacterium]